MRSQNILLLLGTLFVCSSCDDRWYTLVVPEGFDVSVLPPAALRVASYNAFLLPSPVGTWDYTQCRGEEIGRRLAAMDFDIIALQESWAPTGMSKLLRSTDVSHPFRIISHPDTELGQLTTGGLSLLSRWPITEVMTFSYARCHGSDCFSSKGALYAKIQLSQEQSIQVLNTHLDAGDGPKDSAARATQIQKLKTFLSTHAQKNSPIIILGDFNVDWFQSPNEFIALIEELNLLDPSGPESPTVHCSESVSCDAHPKSRVDYIFLQEGEEHLIPVESQHLDMTTNNCSKAVKYLSDHKMVSRHFELRF